MFRSLRVEQKQEMCLGMYISRLENLYLLFSGGIFEG